MNQKLHNSNFSLLICDINDSGDVKEIFDLRYIDTETILF